MKVKEKQEAVNLRKLGLTYREILGKIPISKSSLSYWLRDIQLTNAQENRIYGKNLDIRRKFVEYNSKKQRASISSKENIFEKASGEISDLTKRELQIIGTALYWAEGYKATSAKYVEFTNSDPKMIALIMKWFREVCEVPESKFRIRIQVHDARQAEKATEFWSSNTGIPLEQFTRPYIKVSPTSGGKSSNFLKYGVCYIRISNIELLTKIKGWVNGLGALSSSPV